mmetsp:Transcript_7138/g.10229  ORF Transcript_7138/g.10229 Transcript_7138/m.10229 type:complete len:524 (+) Transcript_7138:113-1684(+)
MYSSCDGTGNGKHLINNLPDENGNKLNDGDAFVTGANQNPTHFSPEEKTHIAKESGGGNNKNSQTCKKPGQEDSNRRRKRKQMARKEESLDDPRHDRCLVVDEGRKRKETKIKCDNFSNVEINIQEMNKMDSEWKNSVLLFGGPYRVNLPGVDSWELKVRKEIISTDKAQEYVLSSARSRKDLINDFTTSLKDLNYRHFYNAISKETARRISWEDVKMKIRYYLKDEIRNRRAHHIEYSDIALNSNHNVLHNLMISNIKREDTTRQMIEDFDSKYELSVKEMHTIERDVKKGLLLFGGKYRVDVDGIDSWENKVREKVMPMSSVEKYLSAHQDGRKCMMNAFVNILKTKYHYFYIAVSTQKVRRMELKEVKKKLIYKIAAVKFNDKKLKIEQNCESESKLSNEMTMEEFKLIETKKGVLVFGGQAFVRVEGFDSWENKVRNAVLAPEKIDQYLSNDFSRRKVMINNIMGSLSELGYNHFYVALSHDRVRRIQNHDVVKKLYNYIAHVKKSKTKKHFGNDLNLI